MPIDNFKTVSQVEGRVLMPSSAPIRKGNGGSTGSYAMFLATLIGHYPWFARTTPPEIVPRQEVRAMQMLRARSSGLLQVRRRHVELIRVVKTTNKLGREDGPQLEAAAAARRRERDPTWV